ncbi:MAG: NAD-dependent epimerase/dehydratase family protein [Vicinamibacteria bacterium]
MFRVGILGCGVIAQEHLRAIRLVPSVTVAGIADLNPKALAETADKFGIASRYESAKELLDKEKPDAVHVVTPPASHHALATLALEAGAHVFLEKPMTLHAPEAEELMELARSRNLLLVVDHNHRFDRVMREGIELVRRGAIGNVVGIDSYYGFDLGTTPTGRYFREAYSHWVYSLPGGLFHNGLDHPLSVVVPFMKEPREVLATAAVTGVLPEGVPGELKILLNDGERIANVTLSESASPRFHYVHVMGDAGTLQVDLQNKRVVHYAHRHGIPHYITRAMMNVNQGARILTGTAKTFLDVARGKFTPYEGQQFLIAEFYRAIEKRGPSPLPTEDAVIVTRIMDRVWEQVGHLGPARDVRPLERWAPGRSVRFAKERTKPRVLVTGATGFIGRYLVEKLVERGADDVRVLVRNLHKGAFLKDLPVEVVYGDLTSEESLKIALEGIDVVYHLGASMTGSWADYEAATVRATELLSEESLAREVKSFVLASTIAVYGVPAIARGDRVTEDTPLATKELTFYIQSKIAAERSVKDAAERGLPATILRLGVVFGPGRPRLSRMGYHAGRFHALVGLNNNRLPGVYVDDAVEALVLAGEKPSKGLRTYNVVADTELKKLTYLRSLAKHRNSRNYYFFVPYPLVSAAGGIARSIGVKNGIVTKVSGLLNPFHLKSCSRELRFDNSRIRSELGWSPGESLEEQLRKTFTES